MAQLEGGGRSAVVHRCSTRSVWIGPIATALTASVAALCATGISPKPPEHSTPRSELSHYTTLVESTYKYADTFVKYSQEPPEASLDDYQAAEQELKDWIFQNSLRADPTVLQLAKRFIPEIRNFGDGINIRCEFGGSCKPSSAELAELSDKLLEQVARMESLVRALDGPAPRSSTVTNSTTTESTKPRPKDLQEALVTVLWESNLGKSALVLVFLILLAFAVWKSLPDYNKSQIIERLSTAYSGRNSEPVDAPPTPDLQPGQALVSLVQSQRKVLWLLSELSPESITQTGFSNALDTSTAATKHHLDELLNLGLIEIVTTDAGFTKKPGFPENYGYLLSARGRQNVADEIVDLADFDAV